MYYLLILSIILSLDISFMQAACSKTHSTSEIKMCKDHSGTPSHSDLTALKDNNSIAENSLLHGQQDELITMNDLHTLRLEYNKYKILSHLGMTANPDELAMRLSDQDGDVRTQMKTGFRLNDDENGNNMATNRRHKRSLPCNQVKSNKDACCLETFYVNFTEIGWDKWILYPSGYNANYCRGQCDLSHARYYHSTLLSKFSNMIGLCCSPKLMAPLRLLYIDENNKVHQKSMPDMIVESCDCA